MVVDVAGLYGAPLLPRGAVAKVVKEASRRHGGHAIGRALYLYRQQYFMFGIHADRISDPHKTHMVYAISPGFITHVDRFLVWLWMESESLPIRFEEISPTIDRMLPKFPEVFRNFSARKVLARRREALSNGYNLAFNAGFQAAVLAFLFDLGDPAEWLTLGIDGATAAASEKFSKFVHPFIPKQIDTGKRALTALSNGSDAFHDFLGERERHCLAIAGRKKPQALLNLPPPGGQLLFP